MLRRVFRDFVAASARKGPFIADLTGRISRSTLFCSSETESHFRGVFIMFQAFVITLREGLEAFLIVAISLAYLRKSGRAELVPAVRWGIAFSILISIGGAFLFQRAANHALWEGVLCIAAALSVASLTVHMWRTARRIKRDIEGHLRTSTMKTGSAAFAGVFLFTLLMITREGMETALLMGTLLFQVQSVSVITGAVVGTLL